MCPSTIPRTISTIGSDISSPSIKTVYKAVIEPFGLLPARSKTFCSHENIEGGYPFIVGGSPNDNPTSRPAIAQRVTVSVIKKTFLP